MNIAILGSGTWGLALARVLCLNGHRITVWSKFREEAENLSRTRKSPNLPDMTIPDGVSITSDLSAVFDNTGFVIFCIMASFTVSIESTERSRPNLSDM